MSESIHDILRRWQGERNAADLARAVEERTGIRCHRTWLWKVVKGDRPCPGWLVAALAEITDHRDALPAALLALAALPPRNARIA